MLRIIRLIDPGEALIQSRGKVDHRLYQLDVLRHLVRNEHGYFVTNPVFNAIYLLKRHCGLEKKARYIVPSEFRVRNLHE